MLEHAEYKSPYIEYKAAYADCRSSFVEYASQYDRQARLPTLAPKHIPPVIDLTLTPPVSGAASSTNPVTPAHEPIQTRTPQSSPPVAHDARQKSA
jgi:hypothetical protein